MGTIKEPYERVDGTRVRQWSITLPVDLIRAINHLAIDRGRKPAELALEALQQYLEAEGGPSQDRG
jgi:predicted DNA-binding protein